MISDIARDGIKEDELWDLHPRDRSDQYLPALQQHWEAEINIHRARYTI